MTSTYRPWSFRLPLRVVVGSATIGALAGSLNWAVAFSRESYARAYLITLIALGASVGAILGAVLLLGARLIAGRSRRTPLWFSRLKPSGPALSIIRWMWISVVGAGLTALVAYLGSAPRFAPLLSREPRSATVSTSQPPNIILFSFDTVRPDHLGAYGGRAAISPNFDALAARGTLFTRCIAASSWTIPSHAAILTGRAPSHIGGHVVLQSRGGDVSMPEEAITLPEIFRTAGYHTAGFIGGKTLSSAFGFDQGFDVFNDGMAPSLSGLAGRIFFTSLLSRLPGDVPRRILRLFDPVLLRVSNYLHAEAHITTSEPGVPGQKGSRRFTNRADEVNQKVYAWLDRRPPTPFFLFVHYFDSHDPYDPPPPYAPPGYKRGEGFILSNGIAERVLTGRGPLRASERDALIAAYDGEIAFMDHEFGILLERLRLEGALDNAVVSVVSDHGESFGEHGLVFHGHYLYDDLIHAGLLFEGRGVPSGARQSLPVAGVDVAATLLELAGIDRPGIFEGRSLAPLFRGESIAPRPLFSEIFGRVKNWKAWEVFRQTRFSVEIGGLKLIRDARGKSDLFDLASDPGELRSLAAERPEEVERLGAILSEYLSRAARPPGDTDEKANVEALEGLRGLGYIQQ